MAGWKVIGGEFRGEGWGQWNRSGLEEAHIIFFFFFLMRGAQCHKNYRSGTQMSKVWETLYFIKGYYNNLAQIKRFLDRAVFDLDIQEFFPKKLISIFRFHWQFCFTWGHFHYRKKFQWIWSHWMISTYFDSKNYLINSLGANFCIECYKNAFNLETLVSREERHLKLFINK